MNFVDLLLWAGRSQLGGLLARSCTYFADSVGNVRGSLHLADYSQHHCSTRYRLFLLSPNHLRLSTRRRLLHRCKRESGTVAWVARSSRADNRLHIDRCGWHLGWGGRSGKVFRCSQAQPKSFL